MKRSALQNKQVVILRMAFRARKVLGTFEKRAPADFDPIFHDLINFPLTEFTSEYFTEMFLSYMCGYI